MDVGAFTSGLLIGLREGVEAALLVAIILSYLWRIGGSRYVPRIWLGVGAAVAVSAVLGIALFASVGGLDEPYEQVFEGLTMLLAAGVVTWMLFWMRRQAASVSGDLQAAVDRVLTDGSAWGLSALAFMAVIREGMETSLFLVGTTQAVGSTREGGPLWLLVGAVAGLAGAVVVGWGFYRGSQRIDLRAFFRVTGVLLVFIAAGLVSHATHEFVEIGVITVGTQSLFDLGGGLSHEAGLGAILRAMFGYTSRPEAITFAAWLTYVGVVLPLYLRPLRRADPAAAPHLGVEEVRPTG
jgi:high-affinity iron transporter